MQAVLCDICNQQINGSAIEMHLFRGEVTLTEYGVAGGHARRRLDDLPLRGLRRMDG